MAGWDALWDNWEKAVGAATTLAAIAAAGLRLYKRFEVRWRLIKPLLELDNPVLFRVAANEFLLERILLTLPEAIFLTDAEGQCTFGNPALAQLFGLERRDLLGTGWLAALHPDDSSVVWKKWQSDVALKIPYNANYRLRDGRKCTASAWFLRDADDVVICAFGMVHVVGNEPH